MVGYSGTPLAKKLGIEEGALVVLLGAAEGFEAALEPLPAGVRVVRALPKKGSFDVALLFVTKEAALAKGLASTMQKMADDGGLWICWPKKSSGVPTEVDEPVVRTAGLATGLVDNKVCAVDETWSGLRFVVRVTDRKR